MDKEIKKVYGPYLRKDGRKHVIIMFTDKSRRTVSYPKYLMEQHLGRELHPDLETVDHIDRDFTNNDLSNLRIIDRASHAKEDALYRDIMEGTCIWCGVSFQLTKGQLDNRKDKKAGPFCSKSCSGSYGADVQNGGKLLDRTEIVTTYHMKDKK